MAIDNFKWLDVSFSNIINRYIYHSNYFFNVVVQKIFLCMIDKYD